MAPIDRANEAAALALGLRPQVIKLARPVAERTEPDIEAAFEALAAERAEAVVALEVPLVLVHRVRIARAAAARRMPSMFPGGTRDAGGVITYGTSVADTWRRIPAIVARILGGANPGELPVELVTRKELVINLRAAEEIGVTIPPALLARADEVIR